MQCPDKAAPVRPSLLTICLAHSWAARPLSQVEQQSQALARGPAEMLPTRALGAARSESHTGASGDPV